MIENEPTANSAANQPAGQPEQAATTPDLTLLNIPVVASEATVTAAVEPITAIEAPTNPVPEPETPSPALDSHEAVTQVGIPTVEMAVPTPPVSPLEAAAPAAPVADVRPDEERVAQVFRTPSEVVYISIERMAAGNPEFVQALHAAKANLESEQQTYGALGKESAPLTDVTFADAVVRSMYNDDRSPAWIKVAGQTVKVDAAGRKVTIWKTYTDEQMNSNVPGFDWDAIKKLHAEATIVATKTGSTESRLEVLDAPKTS